MINLKDNSSFSVPKEDIESFLFLRNIANRDIATLLDEQDKGLLVYPHSFAECKDMLEKQTIFSLQETENEGKCSSLKIQTSNMVGFIGMSGHNISISSRFSDCSGGDYFLHYMIEKTLDFNLFNLPYGTSKEPIFNLLLFLFPKFLNEALRQGIYKEYRQNCYNDSNLRGCIDIPRQIRSNIPFNGRIAYKTREFSQDNSVTELIRHTIEHIRIQKIGKSILNKDAETRANVEQIIAATQSYCHNEREKIIHKNQRKVNHPYFTYYTALQSLCLRILRHDKVGYDNSDNEIYGILIDVSYLWEEYLATLLVKQGFKHPKNRQGDGRIHLAKGGKFPRYPDFYDKDSFGTIIDAKYKPLLDKDNQYRIDRNDIHQLITYMYRLQGKCGILIHPISSPTEEDAAYLLCGYGEKDNAKMKVYSFLIPQNTSSYQEFKEKIKESEDQLLSQCISKEGMLRTTLSY